MKFKIAENISKKECWDIIVNEKLNFLANKINTQYDIQTSDGAEFVLDKNELEKFIEQFKNKKWFSTQIIDNVNIELNDQDLFILENYPRHEKKPYFFGSFAIKKSDKLITTKRGKTSITNDFTVVDYVDFDLLKVFSKDKATLNAPFLAYFFKQNPKINFIIHGHSNLGNSIHDEYEFPGTMEELKSVPVNSGNVIINLKHHGYIAAFETFEDCKNFLIFIKNSQVNWQTYHEDFPERYLNASFFDEFLSKMDYSNFKFALDIGGGYQGTTVLKNKIITDIFDPFVHKPDWIRKQVDLDFFQKYDLIVARGSFNYLSEQDIEKLNDKVDKDGLIVFNTFKYPPSLEWKSRPFNSKNGSGVEKYRLYHGLIDHITEYPNKTIHHYFYYHSQEKIKELLHSFSLDIIDYGNNSVLVIGKKK